MYSKATPYVPSRFHWSFKDAQSHPLLWANTLYGEVLAGLGVLFISLEGEVDHDDTVCITKPNNVEKI